MFFPLHSTCILYFQLNRVYVIFDQPTSVSMIKLWNYSKTPNRGAKDFAVSQNHTCNSGVVQTLSIVINYVLHS